MGKTPVKVLKLTPTDVVDTPEGFEKRFDKRHERPRATPQTAKLPPIEHRNLSDLMSRVGIDE